MELAWRFLALGWSCCPWFLPRRPKWYRLNYGRMLLDLGESPRMIERYLGVFERAKCRFFSRVLRPGMTCLDVGASLGDFTLLASQLVGSQGRVIAFEPEPRNFALLNRHLAENRLTMASAERLAATDYDGFGQLYITTRGGHHSLQAAAAQSQHVSLRVECTRLDEYVAAQRIERVHLLKINVSGSEQQVLDGAQATLARCDAVACELFPEYGADATAIEATLRRAGFEVTDRGHGAWRSPRPENLRSLFAVRRERVVSQSIARAVRSRRARAAA